MWRLDTRWRTGQNTAQTRSREIRARKSSDVQDAKTRNGNKGCLASPCPRVWVFLVAKIRDSATPTSKSAADRLIKRRQARRWRKVWVQNTKIASEFPTMINTVSVALMMTNAVAVLSSISETFLLVVLYEPLFSKYISMDNTVQNSELWVSLGMYSTWCKLNLSNWPISLRTAIWYDFIWSCCHWGAC